MNSGKRYFSLDLTNFVRVRWPQQVKVASPVALSAAAACSTSPTNIRIAVFSAAMPPARVPALRLRSSCATLITHGVAVPPRKPPASRADAHAFSEKMLNLPTVQHFNPDFNIVWFHYQYLCYYVSTFCVSNVEYVNENVEYDERKYWTCVQINWAKMGFEDG